MTEKRNINFQEHPYRGILKNVAAKLGVTSQAAGMSYRNNNPETVKLVNKEIKQRNALIAEKEALLVNAY